MGSADYLSQRLLFGAYTFPYFETMQLLIPTDHIFDLASKYLARDKQNEEHSYFGHLEGSTSAGYLEGWRFLHVETHKELQAPQIDLGFNEVTFIYKVDNPNAFSGAFELSVILWRMSVGLH